VLLTTRFCDVAKLTSLNLVVCLTIRGGPGVFMNVPVREHRALNHQIL